MRDHESSDKLCPSTKRKKTNKTKPGGRRTGVLHYISHFWDIVYALFLDVVVIVYYTIASNSIAQSGIRLKN